MSYRMHNKSESILADKKAPRYHQHEILSFYHIPYAYNPVSCL